MRRAACTAVFAAAAVGAAAAAGIPTGAGSPASPADAQDLPSEPARLAATSLLLDVVPAGHRLVAVGERGHILISDETGRSWRQVGSPTQSLLTGVCFGDAQRGIAVGHDEVILSTQDAGETWKRTHYAPQAHRPLLDVWCGSGGRSIAVGAYGAYLVSEDYGASWTEGKFAAASAGARGPGNVVVSADETGSDFHLNAIAASGPRLYLAAEAGHLYRSDDGGRAWRGLPSPYEGSLFGVLPISGDVLLAYGLRGNLFRSEDAGATWQRIATGTDAMLDGATLLEDGGIAVVGLSGVVLLSGDGGRTFALLQQDDRKGLAAVREVGSSLAVAGESGMRLIREPHR